MGMSAELGGRDMKAFEFEQGVKARTEGVPFHKNPYELFGESVNNGRWSSGWIEADRGDDCENQARGDDES